MIKDKELLKEWMGDMALDARANEEREREMMEDFDYALEQLGFNKEITVAEFAQILHKLKQLGYEVSANDLMDLI